MIPAASTAALAVALAVTAGATAAARCADHVPQPKPQNVGRDVVGKELDALVDQGFMTFAAYEDFAPHSSELGGKPVGVDIDIARLIADALGVEARFQLVAADETLDGDLRNWVWRGPVVGGRVANVMMHVPFDPEFACRVEQVVFTGQYATERVAIAYADAAYPDAPPTPAYFRYDLVAVENDSIADFYLSSAFGGQLREKVRRFPSAAAAMAALASGETAAAMAPRAQLEHGLTPGLSAHSPPLPGLAVGKWTVGLAVNFRYRPLAYAVDDAIYAGLESGRIAAIYADAGLTFEPPRR